VSCDVIGHVTISYPIGHLLLVVLGTKCYWLSFGTKPLSVTISEIFNIDCHAMVDMTDLKGPLNKGQ